MWTFPCAENNYGCRQIWRIEKVMNGNLMSDDCFQFQLICRGCVSSNRRYTLSHSVRYVVDCLVI